MKKYTIIFVLTALALVSCEQFREANDAENIAPISVSVKLRLEMENLTLAEDLLVKFDNYNEGLHLEKGLGVKMYRWTVLCRESTPSASPEWLLTGKGVNTI